MPEICRFFGMGQFPSKRIDEKLGISKRASTINKDQAIMRNKVLSIKKVIYADGYELLVTFSDGTKKRVNLEGDLWGEMFEPLKNPDYFKRVKLENGYTVSWPNGADLAPEYLYAIGKPV